MVNVVKKFQINLSEEDKKIINTLVGSLLDNGIDDEIDIGNILVDIYNAPTFAQKYDNFVYRGVSDVEIIVTED